MFQWPKCLSEKTTTSHVSTGLCRILSRPCAQNPWQTPSDVCSVLALINSSVTNFLLVVRIAVLPDPLQCLVVGSPGCQWLRNQSWYMESGHHSHRTCHWQGSLSPVPGHEGEWPVAWFQFSRYSLIEWCNSVISAVARGLSQGGGRT